MAPEDLIAVPMPRNECEIDDVRCHFYSGYDCRHPQHEVHTAQGCLRKIFLTQEEYDKHILTIITWRMKT